MIRHFAPTLVGILVLASLAGCATAAPKQEKTPEPIAADVTCAQFNDVQTIVLNAQTARKDLRMEEQEYQGWLRLAARALSRIDTQPGTDLSSAITSAQEAAPAVPLGAMTPSGINVSTQWFDAAGDVARACEASGAEPSVERFVGG